MPTDKKEPVPVSTEMEPHAADLSGEVLNRPAPNSGAFRIHQRLPKPVWVKLKQAGAWYWSEDDLEDFDMFFHSPGWRYPIDALQVLLKSGYDVQIDDLPAISTPAELDEQFSPESRRAYYEDKERRAQQKKRAAEEAKELEERERERRGREYAAWKQERLAGLEQTYASPGWDFDWGRPVAHFEKGTPGAWYTTGDTWYRAEVDGHKVYRNEYGNAVLHYGPRHILDRWIEQTYNEREERYGEISAARHALLLAGKYPEGGVIGADDSKRIIEIKGLEKMVAVATAEPWYLEDTGGQQAAREAGMLKRTYGIEAVILERHPHIPHGIQRTITHPDAVDRNGRPQTSEKLLLHPDDGRVIAQTYEGRFFEPSAEQLERIRAGG